MRHIFCIVLFLQAAGMVAQPPPELPPPGQTLAPDQLNNLVAPIALYPDPLLSQILVASTYPLELVQASQWIARNSRLAGASITRAAQEQNWDPSIQALVVFPDLIKRLNEDITWTTNLGNAFLNQQVDVMDAVQRMRLAAQNSGRLESSSQETVSSSVESGRTYIVIEPADPQIIYIPEYDPFYIWGAPFYYPYPIWPHRHYGPGVYFGYGAGISLGLYFGGGWGGWGGWGWNPGWGGHRIIVNNNFIHRYNFNAGRVGSLSGRTDWAHDAAHRQGVPYSNGAVSARFGGGVRQNLQTPRATGQAGSMGIRSQTQGTARMGGRQIAPGAPQQNHGAFGGVRDGGAAARAHSDHGFSSLGPARSGGGGAGARTAGAPHGGRK